MERERTICFSWRSLESAELRAAVEQTVVSFAKRLQSSDAMLPARRAVSLAEGYPGACLLLGQLDRQEPDQSWDLIGHSFMVALQQALASSGQISLDLWEGLAGIVMGARALSRNGTRYQTMIGTLQELLWRQGREWLKQLDEKEGSALSMGDYDVMRGISGYGRCLLALVESDDGVRMQSHELLEGVLGCLVRIAGDKEVSGQQVPGWHVASSQLYRSTDQQDYPNGCWTVGLSHGIAGPLALLSLALRQGIEVPGQRAAIRRIIDWLKAWKMQDEYGIFWPGHVGWEEWQAGALLPESHVRGRESWCYGVPGIARSVWLAGDAMEDAAWKELALEAFRSVGRRPVEQWGLETPTLCHGLAGLLQMTQRMYAETGDAEIAVQRERLIRMILARYEEASPAGFDVEEIGLLNGAVGAALVLAGLIADVEPTWDAVFLIR